MGKNIVPQVAPQFFHDFAFTDKAAPDKEKRPPQLISQGKIALAVRDAESAFSEQSHGFRGKNHLDRCIAGLNLILDHAVKFMPEPVKKLKEKSGFDKEAVPAGEKIDVGATLFFKLMDAAVDFIYGFINAAGPGFTRKKSGYLKIHINPFAAERIGQTGFAHNT